MCCQLVPKSKALHIARYLHGKGAKGYDMGAAVEVGDLDRLKEIVATEAMDFKSNKKVREQGCAALKRCTYSGNSGMAKYLFQQLGQDSPQANNAYNLGVAMHLGDRDRMDEIAAAEAFDINAMELVDQSILSDTRLAYKGNKAGWDKAEQEFIKTYHRTSSHSHKYLSLDFPLKNAVHTGNADTLSWVLDKGADPNQAFDYDGRETAMSFALARARPKWCAACWATACLHPGWRPQRQHPRC